MEKIIAGITKREEGGFNKPGSAPEYADKFRRHKHFLDFHPVSIEHKTLE